MNREGAAAVLKEVVSFLGQGRLDESCAVRRCLGCRRVGPRRFCRVGFDMQQERLQIRARKLNGVFGGGACQQRRLGLFVQLP